MCITYFCQWSPCASALAEGRGSGEGNSGGKQCTTILLINVIKLRLVQKTLKK